MKFSVIPGLSKEKKRLQNLLNSDRIPHAMILSGSEGSGKLALALAFINLLQCESAIDMDSCGQCEACRKTYKMIHPDVHFYFPLAGGKEYTSEEYIKDWRPAVLDNVYLNTQAWQEMIAKENKLLNITAEQCRSMVKKLSMTIYEGKYRVLLIWLPEYLGKEGNILLKLIEEPPANSLILLVTENTGALLNTIQSRCQLISVPPFSNADVHQFLMSKGIKDVSILNNVVSGAEGNMYEALRLTENPAKPEVEKVLVWLRLCFKKNAPGIIAWSEEMAAEGRDAQRQFLKFGLALFEKVLTFKITQIELQEFNAEDWRGIKGLAGQLDTEVLEQISSILTDHISYVERNANPKILFTALSLDLSQLMRKESFRGFPMMP